MLHFLYLNVRIPSKTISFKLELKLKIRQSCPKLGAPLIFSLKVSLSNKTNILNKMQSPYL